MINYPNHVFTVVQGNLVVMLIALFLTPLTPIVAFPLFAWMLVELIFAVLFGQIWGYLALGCIFLTYLLIFYAYLYLNHMPRKKRMSKHVK